MHFVLDHDVDAKVCNAIPSGAGHSCERAPHTLGPDDDIGVWADNRSGALLSHDKDFMRRRQILWYGWHVRLGVDHPDAQEVVRANLGPLVQMLQANRPAVVLLQKTGPKLMKRRFD